MSEQFKIGDTVELNSGGPLMTVIGLRGDNRITCTWWQEATGEYKRDVFDFNTVFKKTLKEKKAKVSMG